MIKGRVAFGDAAFLSFVLRLTRKMQRGILGIEKNEQMVDWGIPMNLFDYMRSNTMEKESPLASRMRPVTLDEVVGQKHIIGKDKLLYRAIKADKLVSVII